RMAQHAAGEVLIERNAVVDRASRQLHVRIHVRSDILIHVNPKTLALALVLHPNRRWRRLTESGISAESKVATEAKACDLRLILSLGADNGTSRFCGDKRRS